MAIFRKRRGTVSGYFILRMEKSAPVGRRHMAAYSEELGASGSSSTAGTGVEKPKK